MYLLDADDAAVPALRAALAPLGSHAIPVPHVATAGADLCEDGPAYEVMYLLDAPDDVPSPWPSPATGSRCRTPSPATTSPRTVRPTR